MVTQTRMIFGSSGSDFADDGISYATQKRTKHKKSRKQEDPFDRIVALCTVRDRSAKELQDRLIKEEYPSEAVTEALERALDCGLVDDVRFADAFIRGRVSAGKGLAAVLRDLEKHGIDPTSLEGWPESYGLDTQAQTQRAVAYLQEHPPRAKDAWSAAFRKLVGKGYSKALATRAVHIWAESNEQH